MYKLSSCVYFTILVIFLSGCSPSYIVKNDNVLFVHWNEGVGRTEKLVKGADASSLKQLKDEEYAKDINNVYWRGAPIEKADPKSFILLGDLYAKDKSHVFWRERIILRANPSSFQIVKGSELWSLDANDYYYANSPIGVIKPGQFKLLDENWAEDGESYYYIRQFSKKGRLLSDYDTTIVLSNRFAKDGEHAYFERLLIKHSHGPTFKVLNEFYAKDKNYVYSGEKRLDGADPATFRVSGFGVGEDSHCQYKFSEKIQCKS